MHIALVHDVERLRHEHRLLARLAIALVAEGCSVTRVIPGEFDSAGTHAGERGISLLRTIGYSSGGWAARWSVRQRAETLADALEKLSPDVIHVIGTEAWRLALLLGDELERPVTLDVWSVDQLRGAAHVARHPALGALVTAMPALAERLAQVVPPDRLFACPWGVACRAERPAPGGDRGEPMLAIIGACRDLAAYEAVLEGVRRAIEGMRDLRIILELREPGGHDVWRLVRRLGLLGHVSCLADAAALDELLLECDVLLVADAAGTLRGLVLEAMERSVPVIAAIDRQIDLLGDDSSAITVDPPVAEEWARRIHRLYAYPEEARTIAAAGRSGILSRYQSHQWAGRLVEIVEKIAGQPALSFTDPRP